MKKIKEIQEILDKTKPESLPEALKEFEMDERAGVIKLAARYQKKYDAYESEQKRLYAMLSFERKYESFSVICGIDEAGRGPLAGPVVAGAVVLPPGITIPYVNDSKKLSEKMRETLYEEIMEQAVSVGVGIVNAQTIDQINILQATYEAMRMAVNNLALVPDILLNDAVTIPGLSMKQVPIIKGDAKSLSIASASIVAKVTRDRMMREYDSLYPQYGFAANKGYGSQGHMEAIRKHGASPIHRRSFISNIVS